jgi:hypothetical protein
MALTYQGYVIVDGDKIAEVGRGNPPALGEAITARTWRRSRSFQD